MNIDGADQRCSASDNGTLLRIAHTLGVSEEVFERAAMTGDDVPAALNAVMQTSALLHAFIHVTEPAARERCLEYVRAEAGATMK